MNIKRILVSQPYPSSEKSPYFDIQKKFGVEITFKPFVRIESLTAAEVRAQKVSIQGFTAIIFGSKTAVDHFFKLADELYLKTTDETHFFCLTETISNYLQKYATVKKRKVHFSKVGKMDDLLTLMKKYPTERYLLPLADVHKEDLSIFTQAKLKISPVVMYRTVSNTFTPDEIASYDMLVFFTPAGIQSLFNNAPNYQQGEQYIGLYGEQTAKAAAEKGLRIDAQGPTPTLLSMAAVLQDFLNKQRV